MPILAEVMISRWYIDAFINLNSVIIIFLLSQSLAVNLATCPQVTFNYAIGYLYQFSFPFV